MLMDRKVEKAHRTLENLSEATALSSVTSQLGSIYLKFSLLIST